ncbi:MAG: tRNA uridine-5-carboxymethylaminomethyl(34) synthesis GTPase MnmE, partial [Bacteroidales bacterium]|nr:tRNA uridine-5-carboxymethylaminomethyl(34) synthesis GTPase MnmE [Bacteroidales bacterium]
KKVKDRIGKSDKKLIALLNKIDQLDKTKEKAIDNILSNRLSKDDTKLKISAKTGENIEQLITELLSVVNLNALNQNEVIITNMRHYEALQRASESLQRAIDGLDTGITGDFLAQDIRETLHYLGEITGEITTNEILGNIFKSFCIGK